MTVFSPDDWSIRLSKVVPSLNPTKIFADLIQKKMVELYEDNINKLEKTINDDNFKPMSRVEKNSDSFQIIFDFFKDLFGFIKSLQFDQNDAKAMFTIILSNCSTLCSYYIKILLSLASKRFRKSKMFEIPKSCCDITGDRQLSFNQIAVMTNDIVGIRQKWFKYIIQYENFLPDHPQIYAARQALTKKQQNNKNNPILIDHCYKLSTKVGYMINFLRLYFTYDMINHIILKPKMWRNNSKSFIPVNGFFSTENNNIITSIFNQLVNKFIDAFNNSKDFLRDSLHIKMIPQLVRGLEDGIFESSIFLAYSKCTKSVLQSVFIPEIINLKDDIIRFLTNSELDNENIERCCNAFLLIPFLENHITLSLEEIENEIQSEEMQNNALANSEIPKKPDYTKLILLNMVRQSLLKWYQSSKKETKEYIFISFD